MYNFMITIVASWRWHKGPKNEIKLFVCAVLKCDRIDEVELEISVVTMY